MGTNYFVRGLHRIVDWNVLVAPDVLHLGKSSMGWTFALHIHPDFGINTLTDWKVLLESAEVCIVDEYGKIHKDHARFVREFIEERERDDDRPRSEEEKRRQARRFGLDSWQALLEQNNAIELPTSGMWRRRIDGRHCVGNGDGTYDLCIGEFS
jgi:hypothetical protein